jgi:hypothetical protein
VYEDEVRVSPFGETVPPADAGSDDLPYERYKPVTGLKNFKFLSIEHISMYGYGGAVPPVTYASALNRNRIALLVFHISDAIYWEGNATWNKEEKYLAIYMTKSSQNWTQQTKEEGSTEWFVNVAWLKGNLCGKADGTGEHLNSDFMRECWVWR